MEGSWFAIALFGNTGFTTKALTLIEFTGLYLFI